MLQELRKILVNDFWAIGLVRKPIQTFLNPEPHAEVFWLPPAARGKFLADPFAVRHAGSLFVFYEEFDYWNGKGIIAVSTVGEDGASVSLGPVIEQSNHVSYPFMFSASDQLYCVPETYQRREVALYAAVDFPLRWEKVSVLLNDVPALDPTLFRHAGQWWLSCTRADAGPCERLFLWYAEDLMGPWRPHRGNPVLSSPRSARPAGTPFMFENELYRPAQNCSRSYGGGIVINRVDRLTPDRFAESEAREVRPLRTGIHRRGLHTLSSCGDLTCIDGKRRAFSVPASRLALQRAYGRLRRPRRPLGHPPD